MLRLGNGIEELRKQTSLAGIALLPIGGTAGNTRRPNVHNCGRILARYPAAAPG